MNKPAFAQMKAYIVEAREEYEGSVIVAVYRSEAMAKRRIEKLYREHRAYVASLSDDEPSTRKFSEYVGYAHFNICPYRLL